MPLQYKKTIVKDVLYADIVDYGSWKTVELSRFVPNRTKPNTLRLTDKELEQIYKAVKEG